MTETLCGGCAHPGHWRECRAPQCYCRRRGPSGQTLCAVIDCTNRANVPGSIYCADCNGLVPEKEATE